MLVSQRLEVGHRVRDHRHAHTTLTVNRVSASTRSTRPRPARNARHNSSPPVGALVFWQTDSSGHVALYAGDGKAYSNDFVENGCIDLTDRDAISVSATYLGWAEPAFPGAGP